MTESFRWRMALSDDRAVNESLLAEQYAEELDHLQVEYEEQGRLLGETLEKNGHGELGRLLFDLETFIAGGWVTETGLREILRKYSDD